MSRANANITKSLKLLSDVTITLNKVARTEPAMRGVGHHVLDALMAAMPLAIREAKPAINKMSDRSLRDLEKRIATFRLVEDLEAAIKIGQRPTRANRRVTIEAIKGVIKKAKHFLPLPRKWVLIIDEILELINKILSLM